MDTFVADVSAPPRNVPRDLQARLYREIGVAAVAAELGISDTDLVNPAKLSDRIDGPAAQAA